MRSALGILLMALVGTGVARAADPYASAEGKYTIKFPDNPKVTETNTTTAVGELTVTVATFVKTDGSTYMVSFADFPASATKADNRASLFNGIRDGVKGKEGKLIGEEIELTIGAEKCPGREFVVEKGRQRIRMRVILRENRVYQVAAIGTNTFTESKDVKAFFDSLEFTK